MATHMTVRINARWRHPRIDSLLRFAAKRAVVLWPSLAVRLFNLGHRLDVFYGDGRRITTVRPRARLVAGSTIQVG